jgi:hypothetical protein
VVIATASPAAQGYTLKDFYFTDGNGKLISSGTITVGATANAGQLKAGTVDLLIKHGAYTDGTESITADASVKVTLADGTYTVKTGTNQPGDNEVKLLEGGLLQVGTPDAADAATPSNPPKTLDPEVDAAVLAVVSGLGNNDTFDVAANKITKAAFVTAPAQGMAPAGERIASIFKGTDQLDITVATTLPPGSAVVIPAGKTLTALAADLKTGGAGTITVEGALVSDKDGADKVTIKNAVITAGGAEADLVKGSAGTVTFKGSGAGSKIALRNTGTITPEGAGTFVAGTATNGVTITNAVVTAKSDTDFVTGAGAVNLANIELALADNTSDIASLGTGKITAGSTGNSVALTIATIVGGAEASVVSGTSAGVLSVPAADITFGIGGKAEILGTGALDMGGDDKVVLTKAVFTSTVASVATAFSGGVFTIDDTNFLELKGGAITTAGEGKVVAGATTFSGEGSWTGTGGGTGGLKILADGTATGQGATLSAGSAATLKASGTPLITQAVVASNSLTIGANVTVDLGGSVGNPAGGIVPLSGSSNPGVVTLAAATAFIKTGNSGNITAAALGTNTASDFVGTSAAGKLLGAASLVFKVTTALNGNLVSIGGAGSTNTIKGHTAADTDVTINSDSVVFAGS